MTNRIAEIADDTTTERDEYLAEVGWERNPFAHPAEIDEYVIPSSGTVADIVSHLEDNTGPILIHSRYSGMGKTTLLSVIMNTYSDQYQTVRVGEHNVSAFELAGIVADELGIGKSSTTKHTEAKIRRYLEDADKPLLLGVDEFGLNRPDTIHVVQNINDLPNTRVILTGMTSQWEAVKNASESELRAFARRVSYEEGLEPFSLEQTEEMVDRRVAAASDQEYDGPGTVDRGPITDGAIEYAHEQSHGVPAVVISAFSNLVGFAAYMFRQTGDLTIDADLAESADYPDPRADHAEVGEIETEENDEATAAITGN